MRSLAWCVAAVLGVAGCSSDDDGGSVGPDAGPDAPSLVPLSRCAAAGEPLVAGAAGAAPGVVWGRLAEAADGTIVAVGGDFTEEARPVTFWRLGAEDITPVGDLDASTFLYLSAVTAGDGVIVIGDELERVRVFDATTGALIDATTGDAAEPQKINGVVLEPGSDRLVFSDGEFVGATNDLIAWTPGGARDGAAAIHVWKPGLLGGTPLNLGAALALESGSLAYGLARTADGARVVVGGPAGTWPRGFLAILDGDALLSNEPTLVAPAGAEVFPDGGPWQMALTTDEEFIVALMMGDQYEVRLFAWDGQEVLRVTPPDESFGMLVASDGAHLITSHRDHLQVWACPL